jgi:hypothetical protein
LPVEADEGFPFSKAHIRVARGHALGCLCGLVSADSWANHRQYFENELLTEDLTKLDVEIAASGRARTFFAEFSWDHDLPKGRGRTEVLKMRGLRPGPIKVITFD